MLACKHYLAFLEQPQGNQCQCRIFRWPADPLHWQRSRFPWFGLRYCIRCMDPWATERPHQDLGKTMENSVRKSPSHWEFRKLLLIRHLSKLLAVAKPSVIFFATLCELLLHCCQGSRFTWNIYKSRPRLGAARLEHSLSPLLTHQTTRINKPISTPLGCAPFFAASASANFFCSSFLSRSTCRNMADLGGKTRTKNKRSVDWY